MSRTEMQVLRSAINMQSTPGKLSKLRLLLSSLEKDELLRSKRVCDGLRKQLHQILKTDVGDNESLASAARYLQRLDRIDPWKQRTRSEKQRLAEQQLAAETTPQPETPAAPTPPTPGGIDIWDLV